MIVIKVPLFKTNRVILSIIIFSIVLRLCLFSGFVMGDDAGYADCAATILKGAYPPLCDSCVFSFRPVVVFSMAGCLKIFGWNQFSFILPILISSIASIFIIYLLGKLLFDKATGLIAAFLLTIFPLNLVHSTTMTNDIMLSFLIATSILFFLKGLIGESEHKILNFSLSGLILGIAIGVKINSLVIIIFFLVILVLDGIITRRIKKNSIYLFAAWFLIQSIFCFVYYIKTNDPFAHIHAEMIFNKKYIASGYANNWTQLKNILLFYPRYMFGILQEGHDGYTFLPYGYFYFVLPIAILYLIMRRDKKVFFPLFWLIFLFLIMEFAPLSITPYYEPIHRLPRFIEIITFPSLLLLSYFLRDAYQRNKFLKILSIGILVFLILSSLYHARKKSSFYRDSIADGKKAYEFIKDKDYTQVITDQEMENLLLFHNQFKNRTKFKSFEYDSPIYKKKSLLIFGGSRRQDMPPSYTLQFYPKEIPNEWRKVIEIEGKKALWRPRNLVVYEIVNEDNSRKANLLEKDHPRMKIGQKEDKNNGYVLIDQIDIGNFLSEHKHDYEIIEQTWSGKRIFRYPSKKTVEDDGRAFKGFHRFKIRNCVPQKDLKIIKSVDIGVKNQETAIYVNNKFVSEWKVPDDGFAENWRDVEFIIPGYFIQTTELEIKEVFLKSQADVNVFFYNFFQKTDKAN